MNKTRLQRLAALASGAAILTIGSACGPGNATMVNAPPNVNGPMPTAAATATEATPPATATPTAAATATDAPTASGEEDAGATLRRRPPINSLGPSRP